MLFTGRRIYGADLEILCTGLEYAGEVVQTHRLSKPLTGSPDWRAIVRQNKVCKSSS